MPGLKCGRTPVYSTGVYSRWALASLSSNSWLKASSNSLRTSASCLVAGLDLVAADQVDAEGRFDRLAHLAGVQCKGCPGKRLVHRAVAADQSQAAAVLAAGTGGILPRRVGKRQLAGNDLLANLLRLLQQFLAVVFAPSADGRSKMWLTTSCVPSYSR